MLQQIETCHYLNRMTDQGRRLMTRGSMRSILSLLLGTEENLQSKHL